MDKEMIQLLRKICRTRNEHYNKRAKELKEEDPVQRMMCVTSACDYATMELLLYYAEEGNYEAVKEYDYY